MTKKDYCVFYDYSKVFRKCPFYQSSSMSKAVAIHLLEKKRRIHISLYQAGNFVFKVNSRNTRKRCEICSELTIKTPERRQWIMNNIVNFEHISHLVLVFYLFTLSR